MPLNRDFNSANGQLVGDSYLPRGTYTKPVQGGKKGWYEVYYGDNRIGTLRPGGSNGKYIADGDPIPEQAYAQINPGASPAGQPPAGAGTASGDSGQGLPSGYLTQLFGPEQFRQNLDPGYQFRLQQGTQGVLNSAAGRTGALSGPALKALLDYNQGAASQEYGSAFDRFQTQQGNIFQRLLSLSSQGQAAAAGVGQQGVATGGIIGGNITGAANAGAAGQIGAANAIAGGIGNAAGALLLPQLLPRR